MRRALVVGLLLVSTGGWLLGWSPYLRVTSIDVQGISSLTRSEVIGAAGVVIGQPLARVTGAKVERGLSSLPRVEKVHIVRSWPHGITLVINERSPIAGMGENVVDDQGVAFTLAPGEKLPVMTISPINTSQQDVKTWIRIYKLLPNKNQITEVDLADMEDIRFRTAKTLVVWGSSEQSKTKVSVLKKLDPAKWSMIDLSAPLAPTTKK